MTKRTGRHQNEASFTRWFCGALEACGAETLTLGGGNVRQQSGLPDRYACHRAFRGWLEFKRGSNRVKTHQKILMNRLVDRGDVCLVVRYRQGEICEIEDPDGESLGWVDLTPLYCLSEGDCGRRLVEELAKAEEHER